MDRRSFLDPRRLPSSAGHLLGAVEAVAESLEDPPPPLDHPLLHLGWRAMATQWEILVPLDTSDATVAAQDAFELLDEIEARLTVYRTGSELSLLNASASFAEVAVAADLFELLQVGMQLHRDTSGAFDLTAGALSKLWGFFRGPRRVPGSEELLAVLKRTGMGHVTLNPARRSVRFEVPGLELNLGGIGKGWALDRLTERLRTRWKIPGALLHGGHSSVYGMGYPPGDPRGWCVGISHPERPGERLARVWLADRALATSAATFQYLEHEGRKLGHILDPRTGWPATGMLSCSVLAPTSAEADALSTAFFILGEEAAREYCKQHSDVGILMLPHGRNDLLRAGAVGRVD